MFKKILAIFCILLVLKLHLPTDAIAVEDPLLVPNNPFGIHILNEHDLEDAAKLVNSSGGDWGYVTFVVRKDERDTKRWQKVFDKMRRLHLIPIVRIATRQQNGGWEKPNLDEIDGWISFLNSLNWVVKNRYVIIGNEPNHAKEWGGEVNPREYADYLYSFSKRLKETSSDFFILPAGFDASAPNNKSAVSQEQYLKEMLKHNPNVFDYTDGWASHSYPNPEFSGSELGAGRGSIRTFEWELNFLKSLGISKDLPVFITETGWAHDMNDNKNGYNSTDSISEKLKTAFNTAWQDPRIVAITPFILNYQEPPFDIFSWKKKDGTFYDFYYRVQKMPKIQGKPAQIESAEIKIVLFPPLFKNKGRPVGLAYVKNTGQTIWTGGEKIKVGNGVKFEVEPKIFLFEVEPGHSSLAYFRIVI